LRHRVNAAAGRLPARRGLPRHAVALPGRQGVTVKREWSVQKKPDEPVKLMLRKSGGGIEAIGLE